ncbi:MAG: CDP-diacylglycerol--glycerol-3-phosphate 3-phosphatidyltransferase [Pirellulales bacterium]
MTGNQSDTASTGHLFNVPNQLTSARLVLAVVLFVALSLPCYGTSLVLFVIAASTDWLDGYWARKYGQVTVLGRILDPFADKIIICGTFIFLAAVPQSEVRAWMAVVVVGRELLVTALRSFLEQRGEDFSASMSGKWKMVLQCVAAGLSLYLLTGLVIDGATVAWREPPPLWLKGAVILTVWAAVVMTVYSGIGYVFAAIRLMRE